MSESDLQTALLLRAPIVLPDLRLFRRNVGVARAASGNMIRFGLKGLPDLYGIWKGGQYIEVELKAARGKLRPEQAAYAEWCRQWGVTHLTLQALPGATEDETIALWLDVLRVTRRGAG